MPNHPVTSVPQVRRGLTLIELLVALAVIGLLVSIILPAVQAAREAARSASCQSRMRQLGVAVQNYHDTYRVVPNRTYETGAEATDLPGSWGWRGHSVHPQLLPFVEEQAVYDRLDFSRLAHDRQTNDRTGRERISLYLCPSDLPPQSDPGCNLAFSLGTNIGFENDGLALPPSAQNGAIVNDGLIGFRDFTDGLSNVLLLSEQVVGRLAGDPTSRRAAYRYAPGAVPIGMRVDMPRPEHVRVWATTCTHFPNSSDRVARHWHRGLPGQTLFNTLLTPNSSFPNCSNHCVGICDSDGAGLFAARSRHPGSVNTGFADGHVRSISEAVAIDTWHRLGNRNDGLSIGAF